MTLHSKVVVDLQLTLYVPISPDLKTKQKVKQFNSLKLLKYLSFWNSRSSEKLFQSQFNYKIYSSNLKELFTL